MAITITDLRSLVDEADSLTGWGGEAATLFTSQPDPKETTGCLGIQVSNETLDFFHTHSSTNLSGGVLVYIWVLPQGIMDTTANGGVALAIGDGTDRIGYHLAGSDVSGFRHDSGTVNWQCLLLDTANLPASFTAYAGSEGNLTLSAITTFGAGFKTLVKSVGGVENCFIDIIRYGNQGLRITGTDGSFDDIATADSSNATGQSYGICRNLAAGVYGLQGGLTFGGTGSETVTFSDTNTTVVFEDRGIATTNRYFINIVEATGNTSFTLGTKVGTDSGSDGCSISSPAGVGGLFDASDTDITTLGLYGSTFAGFEEGILFSADATNGPNHEIFACNFSRNAQITIGLTEFKNNSISASTAATGSVLIDSTTNVSDLNFTSDGTGHGILIDTTGSYTFLNFNYTNFAATDGSTGNEVFYNNSGGLVTLTISGGDTPTVRNGAGASTVLINSVAVTLTGMRDNTEVRVYTTGTTTELDGVEDATAGTTDDRSFTFSLSAGTIVDIRIHSVAYETEVIRAFTIPSLAASIPISQRFDRNFSNQ